MIETKFFLLTPECHQEFTNDAKQLGITLDHYLLEFTEIEGPDFVCVDGEWVEME